MATVTVVTAERTLEIEATSIVDGEINAAGHLILTRHDGTPLDMGAVSGVQLDQGTDYAKADVFSYVGDTDPGAVPDGSVWFDTTGPSGPFASTTQQGLVELATSAETDALADGSRAVTPAGMAPKINFITGRLDALEAIRLQILAPNANTETALPTAYPLGMSLMSLTTGSGWSINSGFGSVYTQRTETDRTVQLVYSNPGGTGTPRSWVRQYHTSNNGGGWTAWSQYNTTMTLTPGTLVQSTAFTSYPAGWSRMYFSTVNGTGWDFAGSAGELMTYVDGADFAKQTFISHGHTSATAPGVWFRTASAANGWSAWAKQIPDTGAWFSYTPTWTTQSGSATPSFGNATLDCRYTKQGRTVHVHFSINFGSTTNFGTSPTSGDNWQFSLPVPAARTGMHLGFVEWDNNSNTVKGMGRARTYSSTGMRIGISTGRVDYSAVGVGDADSVSPWTWVSGGAIIGDFTYESAS